MKTFFKEIFEYNELVNQKVIETIETNIADLQRRTIEIVSHIQLVHNSWNNRMIGKPGLIKFWELIDMQELSAQNQANTQASVGIIENYDLENKFTYHNSKGAAFQNTYADVLFHIINHSSYHRGQINAALRNDGIEPVITEYIFYKR